MRKQGEGHYYFDQHERFYCYVVRHDGRRHIRKAKTQSELREKVHKLKRELAENRASRGKPPVLRPFMEKWLEANDTLRPKTLKSYRLSSKYLIRELGRVRIDHLKPLDVELALKSISKKHGTRTAGLAHAFLRRILQTAIRDDVIQRNPARLVTAPKHTPRMARFLVAEDLKRLVPHLNGRYGPILKFLLCTGLRISEALAVTQFDIQNGVLHSRRGKSAASERTIPLNAPALDAVNEMMDLRDADSARQPWEDTGHLFSTCTGRGMSARNVQRALDVALEKANLPHISLHDLRRTFGTHLAASGTSDATLTALMGHSDVRTTKQFYVMALEEEKRASVLNIGDLLVTERVTGDAESASAESENGDD